MCINSAALVSRHKYKVRVPTGASSIPQDILPFNSFHSLGRIALAIGGCRLRKADSDGPRTNREVIGIKSTTSLREDDIAAHLAIGADIKNAELYCLSRDPRAKRFENLLALPWEQGIDEVLG
jgi:hypothetical protein